MHKRLYLILLTSLLFIGGCSDGGSDGGFDSPTDTNAHPENWFSIHAQEASFSSDYGDCKTCHGLDLTGSGNAVNCYLCHSYNENPPFSVHPPSWLDTYSDHRVFAAASGFASCSSCHGQNLHGNPPIPSCYSTDFNGRSCHADGPGNVPHALDGSYRAGQGVLGHGQDAKFDLTACQSCHGQLGGPGSNPRFNVGFGENACEDCHTENYAHPPKWAGPNNTFHYSADNIDKSCTLCHGINLDGVGGTNGGGAPLSCLGCHDSVVDFGLDCAFCHGYPPDGSADLATNNGVDHRDVSAEVLHVECLICHGMYESAAGGSFRPASNYTLFDYTTETNGDHWDGNIQMSLEVQYNDTNFGCDTASCHGAIPNTPPFQLSDSGLPVVLKNFFGAD